MPYSTRTARAWLALNLVSPMALDRFGPITDGGFVQGAASTRRSRCFRHNSASRQDTTDRCTRPCLSMTRYTPLFALVIGAGAIGCAAHVRVGNQVIGYSARQE